MTLLNKLEKKEDSDVTSMRATNMFVFHKSTPVLSAQ